MDSVKRATSSAGPEEKRPLRETGEFFFMPNVAYFGQTARIVTRGIKDRKRIAAVHREWLDRNGESWYVLQDASPYSKRIHRIRLCAMGTLRLQWVGPHYLHAPGFGSRGLFNDNQSNQHLWRLGRLGRVALLVGERVRKPR